MNREQLRAAILAGDSRIANSAVWRFMSATEKALLKAGVEFWQRDNPVTNAALDDMLAIYDANQKGGQA